MGKKQIFLMAFVITVFAVSVIRGIAYAQSNADNDSDSDADTVIQPDSDADSDSDADTVIQPDCSKPCFRVDACYFHGLGPWKCIVPQEGHNPCPQLGLEYIGLGYCQENGDGPADPNDPCVRYCSEDNDCHFFGVDWSCIGYGDDGFCNHSFGYCLRTGENPCNRPCSSHADCNAYAPNLTCVPQQPVDKCEVGVGFCYDPLVSA